MTDADLWVRRYHAADDATTRLLCLPHAGGSATYFFGVAKALAPEVDVLAVQYPGRQDRLREPCVSSADELADRLATAIEPLTDRPLALFGHSLGATVGFEVARRLERAGHRPTALFASGRRAPQSTRTDRTHLLDDDGLVAAVKELDGSTSSVLDDEDVRRMALPALRADYAAANTYVYRPGPRLHCPITALIGDHDSVVTAEEAKGWRAHTESAFELVVFPGNHFYLSDHMPDVLRRISEHARSVAASVAHR